MKLLKNKRELNKHVSEREEPPKSFPCYFYRSRTDSPEYLYPEDIFKMAIKIRAEIQP